MWGNVCAHDQHWCAEHRKCFSTDEMSPHMRALIEPLHRAWNTPHKLITLQILTLSSALMSKNIKTWIHCLESFRLANVPSWDKISVANECCYIHWTWKHRGSISWKFGSPLSSQTKTKCESFGGQFSTKLGGSRATRRWSSNPTSSPPKLHVQTGRRCDKAGFSRNPVAFKPLVSDFVRKHASFKCAFALITRPTMTVYSPTSSLSLSLFFSLFLIKLLHEINSYSLGNLLTFLLDILLYTQSLLTSLTHLHFWK